MAFQQVDEPTKDDKKPKDTSEADAKAGKAKKAAAKPKADRKPAKSKPGPKPAKKQLEKKLGEFIGAIGVGVFTVVDQTDGIILVSRGDQLAHAWAELAEINPSVKAVLEKLVDGGAWGGVVFSTMAVAVPIAQNHGVAKGLPTPFSLSDGDVEKAREASEMIDGLYVFAESMEGEQPSE